MIAIQRGGTLIVHTRRVEDMLEADSEREHRWRSKAMNLGAACIVVALKAHLRDRFIRGVVGMGVAMINFAGLGKSYGSVDAVRNLTFSVGRGEVFGFLGPNGAGKTTTIRMLMGILVPSAGHITVDGLDCQADRVAVKRRVGYLPDSPLFYDFLRGREILEFVGEMHGQSRGVANRNAERLLGEFGLDEASEEYAVNYSMGMKKKLGLACALIHDPQVLVLDEPTNGLDPRAAREVQNRLHACAEAGKTIFLSTHLLDMAERLCSRLGIIHQGELVGLGALAELQANVEAGGSLEEVFLKLTESADEPAPLQAAV